MRDATCVCFFLVFLPLAMIGYSNDSFLTLEVATIMPSVIVFVACFVRLRGILHRSYRQTPFGGNMAALGSDQEAGAGGSTTGVEQSDGGSGESGVSGGLGDGLLHDP